jgi:hypothetical protein
MMSGRKRRVALERSHHRENDDDDAEEEDRPRGGREGRHRLCPARSVVGVVWWNPMVR